MRNFIKTFLLTMFIGAFAFTNNVKAQMSGTYTVGSGGTYASLTVAYNALVSNGINAPVILSVISDLSGQQTLSDNVPGSSNINTVTITSFNGDATTVTIGNAANTALILDSVSNLVFKNITIGTTTDTTINGVEFRGFCANILFHSCVIQAYDLATDNSCAAVRYNNSSQSINYLSNVRFIKNTIIGGFFNMCFYYPGGSSSNLSTKQASIVIDSNNLKDAKYCGIYNYYYGYYPSISYNTITSRSSSENYNGICSYYYTTIDNLQGNKISITSTALTHGICMLYYHNYSSSYGASGPMYIANNEIRIKSTGTENVYGFCTLGTSDYSSFDILHNSFYLEGTAGWVYGINIGPYSTSHPTNVLNNLVYISTSGSGYMLNYNNMSLAYADTSYGYVNYNNYYKPNGTAYYGTAAYTSLSAWQSLGHGQDANSVNVSPQFIDISKDLQLSSYTGLSCPRIVGVGKDIRNKSRSAITYMGCYEPFMLDAALANDNTIPFSGAVNQSIPIKAILMNYGKDTLKKASINWSIRGVTQSTTIPWTGNLATGKIDTLNVGNITLTSAYTNEVKIWVSAPNESTDQYSTNDTISFNIYGCDSMSGVYTVGNASADFATVEDAKFHLMECGIKGTVELQFISGTYGSISFNENIPGSSVTNTITITSVAQHADSVIFIGISKPALTLENTANICFKTVTFDATNGTHGVELKKSNSGILLYACTILAKPELFFNYYSGVCYAQTSTDTTYLSNVRFIKNKISGGMYNIYLEYAGGNNATTMVNSSIIIDSNELSNAHLGGILSNYYAYFPSISYNIITSHANATIGYYCGIDCYYYTTIDTMKSNKIHITFTSNSTYITYGINTNYNQNTVSGSKGPMFVANNEIMINGEGNATNYGIYASCGDSSQWNFYNNSIYIANNAGTSYGMHWGPTDSIGYVANFINNHVHLYTDGTAVPLIFEDTTYATTSYCRLDYNNYYVSGGPTSVYYADATYKTLTAWKSSAYSQDINSVSIAPTYTDSSNSLRFAFNPLLRAPILPSVYNDINGNLRTAPTTIGAYETDNMDLACDSLISPLNNTHFCQNSTSPIEMSITNVGSFDLNMGTSPLSVYVRITGAINYQKDTIISTGTLSASQTINIMMNNALTLLDTGMYYVSAYFSKIDSNSFNDTVYSQFYVHRSYSYADTVTICSSQLPYKRGDSTFTKGGDYTVVFTTINGCDSTIALTLIEDDAYKVKTTITICDDQLPYTYNDSILTAAGFYQLKYPASPGECDTILYVTLVVNSTYNETDTIKICSSELPYTYGDSVFTEGGDYILPYLTEFGCDSVINLHLKVIEIPVSPLVINGNTTITTAGQYTYYVDPVADADSYVWTISNNNWTGSSTTESIELTISDAGTGTLAVKAVNICGESDTAALDISSSVGILESGIKACYLGQNIPNPANTSTLIPFSIPEAGNVSFEVVSITGQVLYKKDIQAHTGSNSIELNTKILPSGIYYYRIEFNGQRLVKKMTIQK